MAAEQQEGDGQAVAAEQHEVDDRSVVEAFAEAAARDLQDCLVVVLRPWSSGETPPHGILAPPPGPDGLVDQEAVDQTLQQGWRTALVPCTFANPDEEAAAHRILPQFAEMQELCVVLAQLLPPGMQIEHETMELIMQRHDAMLAVGADDVLLDPECEPEALRQALALARSSWELNVQRVRLMLDAEPESVVPTEVEELQAQHDRLLWESIPRSMMPQFQPLNRNILESRTHVGKYHFIKKFDCTSGNAYLAMDDKYQSYAIKIIEKGNVTTPAELECIYREFRFLSEIIQHPNVVRCLDMIHSASRVYLVLETAGSRSLAQALSDQPGQRFDEEETLACFRQISAGLAYCHSLNVAHRSVSMHHVVLLQHWGAQRGHHCKLIDFRCAMITKQDAASRTVCGTLPCIAPEMALGRPYTPQLADSWSLGIVLLEMTGGLSSLAHCLPYDPLNADLRAVAAAELNFFAVQGSHARALAYMGGVENEAVLGRLRRLLHVEPNLRAQPRTMFEDAAN